MEAKLGTLATQHHAQTRERKFFPRRFGRANDRERDEAAPIRLGTSDRSHARAQSPTAQAPLSRPNRGKSSRASPKQRRTAAKLPTLMIGIWRLLKAYAVLWQRLYACFSGYTFDQSRVAAHLDIRDRVSMKTRRLSQVPNRQIERSTRHPNSCAFRQARKAKQSDQGGSK
jgi:hypothetical protein